MGALSSFHEICTPKAENEDQEEYKHHEQWVVLPDIEMAGVWSLHGLRYS